MMEIDSTWTVREPNGNPWRDDASSHAEVSRPSVTGHASEEDGHKANG